MKIKSHYFCIRVTDDEFKNVQRLQKSLGYESASAFVRALVRGCDKRVKVGDKQDAPVIV